MTAGGERWGGLTRGCKCEKRGGMPKLGEPSAAAEFRLAESHLTPRSFGTACASRRSFWREGTSVTSLGDAADVDAIEMILEVVP
eukprot:scaffold30339_cov32-Tisochrysis_lutea.AAC.4